MRLHSIRPSCRRLQSGSTDLQTIGAQTKRLCLATILCSPHRAYIALLNLTLLALSHNQTQSVSLAAFTCYGNYQAQRTISLEPSISTAEPSSRHAYKAHLLTSKWAGQGRKVLHVAC